MLKLMEMMGCKNCNFGKPIKECDNGTQYNCGVVTNSPSHDVKHIIFYNKKNKHYEIEADYIGRILLPTCSCYSPRS